MKKNKQYLPSLLEASESVFRAGVCIPSPLAIDQARWHERAKEFSKQVKPDQLSDTAFTLLQQLPLSETMSIIKGLRSQQSEAGHRQEMKRITMLRKCGYYVVRDLMILSSDENPHDELKPLYETCRYLGYVTDSDGAVGKKRTVRAIRGLSVLQKDPPRLQVASQGQFEQAVADRLEHAELLIAGSDELTYDAYHEARKDFRRVLNLEVAGVTALGFDDDLYNFALEGVSLSNWHGQNKDALCAQEEMGVQVQELVNA